METEYMKCVKWLIDFGILNPSTMTSYKESRDLSLALKDGVALCHLSNKICPGSIESRDFSQNPHTSQFLCLRNARVFIDRCQSHFRITPLFEPADLYYGRDLPKILATLSILSKCEAVSKFNIEPYDYIIDTQKSLKEESDRNSSSETKENQTSWISIGEDADSEYQNDSYDKSIYDDLCSVRISTVTSEEKTSANSKKDMCINELVVTESKYIEALKIIKIEFMKPLSTYIPPANFKTIFHGIDRLWTIHLDFETSLKTATQSGGEAIPDCFISNKEKFLYYGEFCSNLPTGQNLLDKICLNDPKIRQIVRECELSANEGRFKLRDLLAVPMQRILKYHLFLKELSKHSDDNNDKNMLEKALEEIHDLSLFINEVKRDNDTLTAMQLVQTSIIDLPRNITIRESGRYILDGEVKIKSLSENSTQMRQLFLFDMIILVCKSKNNETTYNFKEKILLLYYSAEEAQIKDKGVFGINLLPKTKEKTYQMIFKREDARNKWLTALRTAIDNVCPAEAQSGEHDFKMTSFGRPTICDVCRKLLRGVFFQGYKCSKTNTIVHKNCISQAKNISAPPTIELPPKPNRGSASPLSPKSPNFSNKVKAIKSYNGIPEPCGKTPLIFELNDLITIVGEECGDWQEGEVNGHRGFFPRSHVRSVLNLRSTSYEATQTQSSLQRSASSVLPQATPKAPLNPTRSQEDNNFREILDNQPWYVGVMSRPDASLKLHATPIGTYLVRLSIAENKNEDYAISIRTSETVRHMRISRTANGNFCLTPTTTFKNLTELVNFYQKNSLEKIFPEVQTTLLYPALNALLKVEEECVALFDFKSGGDNQLSLKTGDRIKLISKVGNLKGWWKGSCMGKEGYFPMAFVKEL